jgi:hypothetical protein
MTNTQLDQKSSLTLRTSTTLYITASQGASIISFISLEFCLILLMTLGISSIIGVRKVGHITPQIRVPYHPPNQGPKWRYHITPQIRVPNGGTISPPKSGSQMEVPYHPPKSGSQIEVPYHPPNGGPKWECPKKRSKIRVQNRGPKWGSG